MAADVSQGDLARKIQVLQDRQEIHDALLRYCIGIDRGDLDLILSAFHADARDNHIGAEESAVERFTRTVKAGASMRTAHNLGNVLIQVVDDAIANAQSYLTAWHHFDHEGRTYDWVIAGRYVDRFERRDGAWRIAHRTVVYDFERFEEAQGKPTGHPAATFFDLDLVRGARSREDFMYRRLRF
jgi:hypothetical protein